MEIFLQYVLPYLVTISLTLLSGLITYKVAMAQSKSDMAKQREQFLLEGKNYIKNLHSEEKFKIYHSLMETALAEIQDTSLLFPYGLDYVPQDEREKQKLYLERYSASVKSYNDASAKLNANACFVSKDIYEKFAEIRELCRLQIVLYPDFILNPNEEIRNSSPEEKRKCWDRTKTIQEKENILIDFMRERIEKEEN
jgi:hypothetical protein